MTTENNATDAIGVVNNTIGQTYAVFEDYLKYMGVDNDAIAALKNNATIKGYIGNTAQIAAAYFEGDVPTCFRFL